MVDEEIKDVSGGPTGAPVNRDSRREPEVIEGEIAARDAEDSNASPYETAAETRADPRPAARAAPRTGARSLLAGAVGGIVVSALGLGAGYSLLTSKADGSDTENRLGALEAQARQTNDALGAEANRESAAVAALGKRISRARSQRRIVKHNGPRQARSGIGSGQRRERRRKRRDPAFGGSGQGLARRRRRRKGPASRFVGPGREARIRRAKGGRRRPRSGCSRRPNRQDRGRPHRAQE